ncbi:MAG: hypothetical protein PUC80_03165, partial [Stecheria intestinalis]
LFPSRTQKLSTAGAKIAERTSVNQARCRVIDGRASALPLFFMLLWSIIRFFVLHLEQEVVLLCFLEQ